MINDYPELIAEVSIRTGVSDVANRAKMFVGMAENMLSKKLRLGGMEKAVKLTTDASGAVGLPSDYQEMRSILVGYVPVDRLPIDSILLGSTGYAVQGGTLKSSYKTRVHDSIYYASLPSLEDNNTNWLLSQEPEIYLHSVLFQVFTAEYDMEKAALTRQYLENLIEEANRADYASRHSGTQINMAGLGH